MNVKLYDQSADGEYFCWEGELTELLASNGEGLDEDEVGRLEGLGPGQSTKVGMGFRVERTDGVPLLRVLDGGQS